MSDMLSELVWLEGFGKDGLAAMSIEELETCLADAKRRTAEQKEREHERLLEEGSFGTREFLEPDLLHGRILLRD